MVLIVIFSSDMRASTPTSFLSHTGTEKTASGNSTGK